MAVNVRRMRRLAVPVLRALGAIAALVVVAPAALGGCGNPDAAPAGEAVVTTAAAVPASLSFSAAKVGGGVIDLRAYAGKPVTLWFWAPT